MSGRARHGARSRRPYVAAPLLPVLRPAALMAALPNA